jgi:hypothetical protein
MDRAYYDNYLYHFLAHDDDAILGQMARKHQFALDDLQKNAWLSQTRILKSELEPFPDSYLLLEYAIPRMGKRADAVLLASGAVFVIEFKVGAQHYSSDALEQVVDYALDLKNFHEASHTRPIIPILVATHAPTLDLSVELAEDGVFAPIRTNARNIRQALVQVMPQVMSESIGPEAWKNALYKPTPTIVEAAQALYKGHDVSAISRSDSSAYNLAVTSNEIGRIIDYSKAHGRKSICFITGVPGAGKTLAGLNIANQRLKSDEDEHAVFLSGNGPLVKVLREALARDAVEHAAEQRQRLTKKTALMRASTFIQNVHHFRDDALTMGERAPTEQVVVFDEAQRAWTSEQTASFMQRKRGVANFAMSEPEFLISIMDRHSDWATIICLIGGGQEINTGEAGLQEWLNALRQRFTHWDVYMSGRLTDYEYTRGLALTDLLPAERLDFNDNLHLAVSVRSFRSEKVSAYVKAVLDCEWETAAKLYQAFSHNYPIVLTRNINQAKAWLRRQARGSERYGIITSSGAYRLRPYGINVKVTIDPENWFLNPKDDIRSSYFLEDVATEFDIQGLELDWTCVAWGADFRYTGTDWDYKSFRGTVWQNVNDEMSRLYRKNAYRVLLTRARQGMVIFIPEGDPADPTRLPQFYDSTYVYLRELGLICL